MNQTSINYAKVLMDLKVSEESIIYTRDLFEVHELFEVLNNPVISVAKKHSIIDKLFPEEIKNTFKILVDYRNTGCIYDIFTAYEKMKLEEKNILSAKLIYVTPPDIEQLDKIKEFLCEKNGVSDVQIEMIKDESLIGGFILKSNEIEYDWSVKGRINQLTNYLKV